MLRRGMSGAIASKPTVDMRAELEAAGTAMLTEEELAALSKTFNEALDHMLRSRGESGNPDWHAVFREFDKDGSGVVTYDELKEVVRSHLKQDSSAVPGVKLRTLWCMLDADDSNQLTVDEFAKFAKLGVIEKKAARYVGASQGGLGKGFSFTSAEAVASQPTKEMRAELEAAGVPIPDEAAQTTLSQTFTQLTTTCFLRMRLATPRALSRTSHRHRPTGKHSLSRSRVSPFMRSSFASCHASVLLIMQAIGTSI